MKNTSDRRAAWWIPWCSCFVLALLPWLLGIWLFL